MDFAEDWADITNSWFYWTESEEESFKDLLVRFNITAENYQREGVVEVISQHIVTKTIEEISTHLDQHFGKKTDYKMFQEHTNMLEIDFMSEYYSNQHQNKRVLEPNIFDSNSNDGTYLHSSNMLHSMNNLDHDLTTKSPQPQDSLIHHHQLEDFQLDQNQFDMNQKILQSNLEFQERDESPQPEKPVDNKRKRPVKETPTTNKKAATKVTKTTKAVPVTKKATVATTKKKTSKTTAEKQEFSIDEKFFQDWYVDTPDYLLPLKTLFDKNQLILKQLISGLKDFDAVNQKILMKRFYDNYKTILLLFEESNLKQLAPELPSSLNTYFITDLIDDKIN